MVSITASATAQAIGPPPKVVPMSSYLSCPATRRDSSSADTGKPLPKRLGGRDDVGRDAVVIRAEGRAGAAHAALHLVENQHRAHLVAAPAQRLQHRLADVVGAAHALDRLDDHRRGVAIDESLDARRDCRAA